MIKQEFWEMIANVWVRKENIEIPEILDIPDVQDDYIDLNEEEDWDELLKTLFE